MAKNPKYSGLLDEMLRLHDRKNADYAESDNPYSNFEFAAHVSKGFTNPIDRVFATLLGIKMARLIELTKPGRSPQNEAVEDTYVDLANYAAIWASYGRPSEPDEPKVVAFAKGRE